MALNCPSLNTCLHLCQFQLKLQAVTLSLPFFKVRENTPAEIYFKGVSFFIKSCNDLRQTEEQQVGGILQLANVPYFVFQQRILTITHCVGKPHDDNINSLMQAKELQTFLNQHKHIPKSVCRPADMHPFCFAGSLAHGWLRSEPRVSVKDQRRSGVHCCKAQTILHSQRAWLLPQLMSAEPFLQQYIRTAIWEGNSICTCCLWQTLQKLCSEHFSGL